MLFQLIKNFQRLIVEESEHTRYTFENILWLILKSYFSTTSTGRDVMIGKSEWIAEDEKIVKARKQYMMVMDMIKEFKFEVGKNDKGIFYCTKIKVSPKNQQKKPPF